MLDFLAFMGGNLMFRLLLTAACIFAVQGVSAAPVFKCVGADGKTTFSQHGCESDSSGALVTPEAARPSGDGPSVKLATPTNQPPRPRVKRSFNHCGDLTQVDIAYLNGRGQIQVGMTADDVRRSIGGPAEVNRASYGDQWIYVRPDGSRLYLYIDPNGCFTSWN